MTRAADLTSGTRTGSSGFAEIGPAQGQGRAAGHEGPNTQPVQQAQLPGNDGASPDLNLGKPLPPDTQTATNAQGAPRQTAPKPSESSSAAGSEATSQTSTVPSVSEPAQHSTPPSASNPPANQAPTEISFASGGAIQESVADGGDVGAAYDPGGQVVGVLQSADPDAGDTHSYTLISDPSGKFEIIGDELRLRAGESLVYERAQSLGVIIRSTDQDGDHFEQSLTENVLDFEGGETLIGSSEDDQITRGDNTDHLTGGLGHDTLRGSDGADASHGEPPRFCRRLITPFHATLSNWLHCSQNFSSASAGGMFPMGCSRRRLL
ncbi:MAG: hypothetical protein OIF40_01360, partial [Mangrovicoccus sp.]|nr:hypothetical protein [Mangrovicoccus sp.]